MSSIKMNVARKSFISTSVAACTPRVRKHVEAAVLQHKPVDHGTMQIRGTENHEAQAENAQSPSHLATFFQSLASGRLHRFRQTTAVNSSAC